MPLVFVAISIVLTSCYGGWRGTQGSPIPQAGFLRLSPGQTHRAEEPETWVSLRKHEVVEKDLIDALTALQQLRAQR